MILEEKEIELFQDKSLFCNLFESQIVKKQDKRMNNF